MPAASVEKGAYYVFEMSARDRKQPLRQVNKSPLTLEKAKTLARIGAQKGKHDRAVTTSPTSRTFRIVAQYAAGAGKDVSIMYRRGAGGAKKGVPRKKRATRNAEGAAPGEPEAATEPMDPEPEQDEPVEEVAPDDEVA
jgi:hypothetical protein